MLKKVVDCSIIRNSKIVDRWNMIEKLQNLQYGEYAEKYGQFFIGMKTVYFMTELMLCLSGEGIRTYMQSENVFCINGNDSENGLMTDKIKIHLNQIFLNIFKSIYDL